MHFRTLITTALTFLVSLAPLGANAACGTVTNNAGRTLLFTKDPNPILSAQAGRCRFWNWYDGDSLLDLIPRDKLVSCSQQALGNGQKAGGCDRGGPTGGDVDGFTFPNDPYWIGIRRVPAGVWTKFSDPMDFVCRRARFFDRIDCRWTI